MAKPYTNTKGQIDVARKNMRRLTPRA
jgi:hypothetical protein